MSVTTTPVIRTMNPRDMWTWPRWLRWSWLYLSAAHALLLFFIVQRFA